MSSLQQPLVQGPPAVPPRVQPLSVYSKSYPDQSVQSVSTVQQVCVADPVLETTKAVLAGRTDVAVDIAECAPWLPQYSTKTGVLVGKTKPLAVFLVTSSQIPGVASAHDYTGKSGVYTCPRHLRLAFSGQDIVWIEGSRRLRSVKKTDDVLGVVSKKLVRQFTKYRKVRSYVDKAKRVAAYSAPLAAVVLASM